nr:hypothetical protein BaRGS_012250 [Batillaria attramentaria]
MAQGGQERETVCELCGGVFPNPVTYHMRQFHPGCGRHACGKGYNSSGNFCGGWAGNCGEGGMGGSSWYLMCDRCRDKYLREKRHAQKEKDKARKMKKKSGGGGLLKQATMSLPQEAHLILKENAMFLLDLASASGLSLPKHNYKKQPFFGSSLGLGSGRSDIYCLPSVSETLGTELEPFPPVPFQYLSLHNAHSSDSAFAEDFLIDDDERVFESRTPILESKPIVKSAGTSPESEQENHKKSFHRSVSEYASEEENGDHDFVFHRAVSVSSRRRNNSGADGGVSLLKHPSAAMTKLINSVDRSKGAAGNGERALQRPVMEFIVQRHDLDGLQLAMKQALRKAACRVFAMQAFNWLLRTAVQQTSLHDLLWFFVVSLMPSPDEEEETENPEAEKEKRDKKDQEELPLCEHPLSDICVAGKAVAPMPEAFQGLLQSISDVMLFLPMGSPLQRMAVQCYCLRFMQSDHQFLHESHVFSNISRILSKSEEENDDSSIDSSLNRKRLQTEDWEVVMFTVSSLKDLTPTAEIKASSRQAMIGSLSDNSTETFWESGDEDRNRVKTLTIVCSNKANPSVIYVHVDNSRDLANKVNNITFSAGVSNEEMKKIRSLELKGPDQSLRVRQVKILGALDDQDCAITVRKTSLQIQQDNCEAETLKVFRILTSQVFGRLISAEEVEKKESGEEVDVDNDLKEHMVSILFSRNKLSHLQKQVCAHIVDGIRKEAARIREEWENCGGRLEMFEEYRLVSTVTHDVKPQVLANLLSVPALPPVDYSIVSVASKEDGDSSFDPHKPGILDVFLACIAKALSVQIKTKMESMKLQTTMSVDECLVQDNNGQSKAQDVRWWLRGSMSPSLAGTIINLLQDMTAVITKAAIAESILNLTKLDAAHRQPDVCTRLPTPTCDNHDDGMTTAIILCNECGNLCADCDRFLHLPRRMRSHPRQVFKEEEEAIKVDLHEGCGRTKLFWVMALADSKTLKAMVEFRVGKQQPNTATGTMPFLRQHGRRWPTRRTRVLRYWTVAIRVGVSWTKSRVCRVYIGVGRDQEALKQDADDMCMICFTEALSAAPAIQLKCGHVFHLHCTRMVLEKRWVGPRITFGFSSCPICKNEISHPVLRSLLDPIRQLYDDVRRKALMRLEYEGLHKAEAITTPGARFHQDPAAFAMDRYAYYVCFKCKKAYYGGEARCEEQAGGGEDYDPKELMCPKHGSDFLEYKCRYCCSVAVFFCFGTTHFCNACHDDFQRVTNIPKTNLPRCPAGE